MALLENRELAEAVGDAVSALLRGVRDVEPSGAELNGVLGVCRDVSGAECQPVTGRVLDVLENGGEDSAEVCRALGVALIAVAVNARVTEPWKGLRELSPEWCDAMLTIVLMATVLPSLEEEFEGVADFREMVMCNEHLATMVYREVCLSGDSDASEEEKGVYAVGDETVRWSNGGAGDEEWLEEVDARWKAVFSRVAGELVTEGREIAGKGSAGYAASEEREFKLRLGALVVGVVTEAAERVAGDDRSKCNGTWWRRVLGACGIIEFAVRRGEMEMRDLPWLDEVREVMSAVADAGVSSSFLSAGNMVPGSEGAGEAREFE